MQQNGTWKWITGIILTAFLAVLGYGLSTKSTQIDLNSKTISENALINSKLYAEVLASIADLNARSSFWADQKEFNKELLKSIKELNDKINTLNVQLIEVGFKKP